MRETVKANQLTLCHKHSDGYTKSTLPDVCRSPVAPVPYTNVAYARDLADGTTTVLSNGGAMNGVKGSQFAISYGDEPGVGKGVISNTVQAEATWLSWSPNVFMEKRAVTRFTDKMWMNHANTVSIGGFQVDNPEGNANAIICTIGCYCYVSHFGTTYLGKAIDHFPGKNRRYSECFKEAVREQYSNVKFGNPGSGTGLVSEQFFKGPVSGATRHMDAIWMQSGTPTNMYDLKFGDDVSNTGDKLIDYNAFASQNKALYREFRIPDECDGCKWQDQTTRQQMADRIGAVENVLGRIGLGALGGRGGGGGFVPVH